MSIEEVALSDTSSTFRRAGSNEYAFRVPTPPRIIIPPPAHNLVEALESHRVTSVAAIDTNDPDVSFLATINNGELPTQGAGLDWTYEKRRDAQMVMPYIYLGPHNAAKNRDFLSQENITMLLAVKHAGTPVNAAARVANEMGILFHTIDVRGSQDLIASFPRITRAVNTHLAQVQQRVWSGELPLQHGKVLIFCESGNEKSAAAVVAWMMEMLDLDFLRAMQFVQCQRFCVNFDDNLKIVLRTYGDILNARRQVEAAKRVAVFGANGNIGQSSHVPNHQVGSKRTINNEDEDMDMVYAETDDVLRFQGRDYVPFESVD
ncbi:protein-tyrosine phosphatase-like protein [Phyllosticta capitalensis]|uniref:Protein-tyrosine phosphatase-like protein n=1 Tax=Phyllosticta capitalensis TaxID=121624 RepID=A0ABR1YAZ8_9PEZI